MSQPPCALSGVRVLDIAGAFGNYCGKLFADLGAETILVEPPEGAATRHEAPFAEGVPQPEASYRFAYENTSKQSIVLDLTQEDGRAALASLAAGADVLIEGFGAGGLERLGLSPAALRASNPKLVVVRISPYGQTGPFANWKADDNTLMAMGGMMSLAGYPDAAPLASGGMLAINAANLQAAVGGMIALTAAELTGQGQDIDLSIQETVVLGLENAVQFWDLEGVLRRRYAGEQRQAGAGLFRCADGHVFLLAGGVAQTQFWFNTVKWIEGAGRVDATPLRGQEWVDIAYLRTTEAKAIFSTIFEDFASSSTMAALYEQAQAHRVPLCPVNRPADLLQNRQLAHRGFFVRQPEAMPNRDLVLPGAPYRLSATPWRLRARAPRQGEHTATILEGIGK